MDQWEISQDWWARHTTWELAYSVTFLLPSLELTNQVWERAGQGRNPTATEILVGGAYLERVGPRTIEVGSGGEDALDSLEWAINTVLFTAIAASDPTAQPCSIREERRLVIEDQDTFAD